MSVSRDNKEQRGTVRNYLLIYCINTLFANFLHKDIILQKVEHIQITNE